MTRVLSLALFLACATIVRPPLVLAQSDDRAAPAPADAAIPGIAPEAVTAVPGDGRVVVSWRAVPGAVGYHIYRAVDGVWQVDSIVSVAATTLPVDGLTNGTRYGFAVAAYNAAGVGPWSSAVTAVPSALANSPANVPLAFTVVGRATSEAETTSATAPASQDAPARVNATTAAAASTPPPTSAVAGLILPRLAEPPSARSGVAAKPPPSSPSPATHAQAAAAPAPPAAASTAAPAPATAAAPRATTPTENPRLAAAVPSEPVTTAAAAATPAASSEPTPAAAAPTVPPAGLYATTGDARVMLTWQPVTGAFGYLLYRATEGVWTAAPIAVISGTAYTNTGLVNGTWYTYRVAAYTDGGSGPQSSESHARPLATPRGLKLTSGDGQLTLTWQISPGATAYTVFRSTSDLDSTFTSIGEVQSQSFVDAGLTNGTRYYYRVRASAWAGLSPLSDKVSGVPVEAPPAAPPGNVSAAPGNARITLAWSPVARATSYRVFRAAASGVVDPSPVGTVTTPTFTNTGLVNGTAYFYRVAARNLGGDGPLSELVTATPTAPPAAPAAVRALGGDRLISLKWAPSAGAASYNVYRGTAANAQAATPIATGVTTTEFFDSSVQNGPSYYYKVTALNAGGESARSPEAVAAGDGPPAVVDAATQAAYRLLRHSTWGPRPADVEHVKAVGAQAFIDGQLAMGPSAYPDTLFTMSLESTQEHFMQLALTGPDQLRQRVAWALHKIWVVSAVEVPSSRAIVTYQRLLMAGAFGNYRDLMRAITLNPGMGRYLNMLNNRGLHVTGVPPNENYARELLQLFTLGVARLNLDGTPMLDASGMPLPAYTEEDVVELARALTGWTFGDGNPATVPTGFAPENYGVPMEPVRAYHDPAAKVLLGQAFTAHQLPSEDLEQALDIIFNHPNVGPFVSRQLIQQLVTSNPSPAYVAAVATVFNNPAARGDLAAVVRAILLHPEAAAATPASGKLSEPVLFVLAPLRALGATVADYPFMADRAETMGQRVFYPPSVFSYFSPGFRVRGTAVGNSPPLGGPEFQILTSVTTLERANYIGSLVAGRFGANVTVDYTPFNARAGDPAALVDYCNLLFLGGRMSPDERAVVIRAVRAASTSGDVTERVRTALYLTLVLGHAQVDR